jgi:UDPglucose 6-dehydrogenase
LRDAHAAVVCTEWDEVQQLTGEDFGRELAYPIVIDGRNCLDRDSMRQAGVTYRAIGKPPVGPA